MVELSQDVKVRKKGLLGLLFSKKVPKKGLFSLLFSKKVPSSYSQPNSPIPPRPPNGVFVSTSFFFFGCCGTLGE